MSVREKLRVCLRQGGEVLKAEAIAQALPELNRKIVFSLQKFMVCLALQILVIYLDQPHVNLRWEVKFR
jgi:hypothetical protein